MYEVIKQFRDRDRKIYKIGDDFNSDDEKRIELLSTDNNSYGTPFIKKKVKPRSRKKKDNQSTVEE